MDKIQNLKDLEYYGNILLVTELVNKYIKMRPNNKELKKLGDALLKVSLYVVGLQDDLAKHKEAISDYRYRKNKALLELEKIKKKYTLDIGETNETIDTEFS
tara:strand:- start:999 stop:1304 length:306 start_codon:yes stop_codon:yes gene_type:complete